MMELNTAREAVKLALYETSPFFLDVIDIFGAPNIKLIPFAELNAGHHAILNRQVDAVISACPDLAGLDHLQQEIGEWGAETFPNATDESILAHLREEISELDEAVSDWHLQAPAKPAALAEEIADCMMLLSHIAHRHGVSLQDALRSKFEVNKQRIWGAVTEQGYTKHVDDATTDERECAKALAGKPAQIMALMVDRATERFEEVAERHHHWGYLVADDQLRSVIHEVIDAAVTPKAAG